ncbi:MAG: class I SAM-dependent methyltransferase [Vicinamibacteria bacterium]|nr:class I SAM-dependent methyltransferase [Vicinamibacteria bacterium]
MKSYAERVACACGGPNKRALEHRGEGFYCSCCLTRYPYGPSHDYVDLLPRTDVGRVSHYADEEFQERLGVREGEPVLSAGVKARMVSRMLGLKRGDAVLDLGSGAGKFAGHFARQGASVCGVDMAPFFLKSAIDSVSLVVGDIRRLPLRNGATSRAYSLDVLEHLDEAGVREVLVEARRAVTKDGKIFVYTHAMESSKIASFQRGVNHLAKRLGRMGLVDSDKEAMRKSDHINAIRSHEHFDEIAKSAGLRVKERAYYNVFAKAVVEDLALKVLEQRQRKKAVGAPSNAEARDKAAGSHIVGRVAPSSSALFVARGLTRLLMLDVALFGKVRTGPFFGVLSPI